MLLHFDHAEQNRDKYDMVAVEGAILIEAKSYLFFDELWVVTLPKEQAIERIRVRNPDLPEQQIRGRLASQMDDDQRLTYAQFHYCSEDPFETNARKID